MYTNDQLFLFMIAWLVKIFLIILLMKNILLTHRWLKIF